ncbi:MAG: GNAT family N-acetyltransferase [Myxococcota bacterium]
MAALLDAPAYRRFLSETHPELAIDDARLGGVPSFLAPLDVREPLRVGPARRAMELLRTCAPALVTPPALFLGTPFERYDQSHLLREMPDVFELTDRVDAASRRHRREVAVLTNVRPSAVPLERWRAAGWWSLPSFPDTVVHLATPDFEAHLKTLPQGDRSGIRRNIRKFERAGHVLERIRDAAGLGDPIYACYRPFFERATVRWQPHTLEYFAKLTELGDDVRLHVARSREGELIGFVVSFRDVEGFQAGRIGVHPDYYRRDAVYFRLLYHVLEEALEERKGGGMLSLEPTGYRMKRHLGAEKVPLVNLVRGISETWSILLGQLGGLGALMLRHLEDRATLERLY